MTPPVSPVREAPCDRIALEREALRVYRRYQVEVVEAFNFCPWAEDARREGRVSQEVLFDDGQDVAPTLAAIDRFVADESLEIALLIYPLARLDRRQWERFHARAREADAVRFEFRSSPVATAAFHPHADADLGTADRLKPFLRRSPDPTIQVVRMSVLDAVKGDRRGGSVCLDPATLDVKALLANPPAPPVSVAVANSNLATVERRGVEAIRAVLDDIARDRDAAYAALGVPGG